MIIPIHYKNKSWCNSKSVYCENIDDIGTCITCNYIKGIQQSITTNNHTMQHMTKEEKENINAYLDKWAIKIGINVFDLLDTIQTKGE